jgi:hypothetical protein
MCTSGDHLEEPLNPICYSLAGLYDPKWLRRHVALVSQEPVLFARSVRRNIIYGMEQEDGCSEAPTQVLTHVYIASLAYLASGKRDCVQFKDMLQVRYKYSVVPLVNVWCELLLWVFACSSCMV